MAEEVSSIVIEYTLQAWYDVFFSCAMVSVDFRSDKCIVIPIIFSIADACVCASWYERLLVVSIENGFCGIGSGSAMRPTKEHFNVAEAASGEF